MKYKSYDYWMYILVGFEMSKQKSNAKLSNVANVNIWKKEMSVKDKMMWKNFRKVNEIKEIMIFSQAQNLGLKHS